MRRGAVLTGAVVGRQVDASASGPDLSSEIIEN